MSNSPSLASRPSMSPSISPSSRKSSAVISPKRKGRRTRKVADEVVYYKRDSFDIAGVARLVLSPITQKIVGCVIGDDVTAENPWTNIKKDLIEDNIDLHEESSEFISIRKEIHKYPEGQVLLGWIPGASTTHDEFYVVYTLEAKAMVQKIIERHKLVMEEKLQRSIFRQTGRDEL